MIEVDISYPPSLNHIWRYGRRKVYKSPAYASWAEMAAWQLSTQTKQSAAISGRFRAIVRAHPPDGRKRDLDNIIKPILDLLQHVGLIRDDSLCQHLDVGYDYQSTPKGMARLTVTPV